MPRRDGPVVFMETLSVEERRAECKRFQEHWYRLVGVTWAEGRSILDVGAGTGYGMDIMRSAGATKVDGIDPLPLRPDIAAIPIAAIPTKSYDLVVACDVIEHVEEDVRFFADLIRVARQNVFIATPNWNVSRAKNLYHVREYTPAELRALIGTRNYVALTSDDALSIMPIEKLEDASSNFGVYITVRVP